jgi:hypothetical protein
MARADLLKKLFSNFMTNNREGFVMIAKEIIEDERKKNHVQLANELSMLISNGSPYRPKELSRLSTSTNSRNEG